MNIKNIFLGLIFIVNSVSAQTNPFDVYLEPLTINGLSGVQSYAFAKHNGKWLIVGGRLDGLHRRQPFAAFDVPNNNGQLIVIDPVSQQKWTAPISSLPVAIQEQLSSTNMQFIQEGNLLYFVGGYGYNTASAARKTFSNLTAIEVSSVIDAVVNGTSFNNFFRQINDPLFAVTGGQLKKVYDKFYLVGGHKFDGNYNPMGNPTYTQVYTSAIRKFSINDNGTTITVTHYPEITDADNLHRRDYNVVPQILPNGQEGLTAFSGVFQTAADIPYLNSVNIDSTSYTVNAEFAQYYNHYHCANFPVYSQVSNQMHSVFFGGIAQYYDSLGTLVQNNNVPFVKTIARVTRNADGLMEEYKLPVEMPSLLGAGSEFIMADNIPHYSNDVIKFDELNSDTTLLGYIFGGISSAAPNIFFTNTGTQSSANSTIFKVFFVKNNSTQTHVLNKQSVNDFQMQVYPNPNNGVFKVKFNLTKLEKVTLKISDSLGKDVYNQELENLTVGENIVKLRLPKNQTAQYFIVNLETVSNKATQKIILEP